jgi:membrane protease YdiL (CAAX protease family)
MTESQPRSPTRLHAGGALAIGVGFFAAQVLGGGILGFAAALAAGGAVDLEDLQGPAALAGIVTGSLFLLPVARALGREQLRDTTRLGVAWRRGAPRELVAGAVSGLGVAALGLFVTLVLLPPDPDATFGPMSEMVSTPGADRIYVALVALGFAPVLEELLFRGLLLSGLSRSWGNAAGAVAASGLFITVHIPELAYYWPGVIGIGALALTTLALRLRCAALGPAIAAHFTYNAALLATAFAASG